MSKKSKNDKGKEKENLEKQVKSDRELKKRNKSDKKSSDNSQNKNSKEKKNKKISTEFKELPNATRVQNRAKKFNSPSPLKVNPLITIFDQHEAHKLRIVKISALIFLIAVLIILGLMFYNNNKRDKAKKRYITNIEKRIAILDAQISSSTGYEKDQTIVKAIEWSFRAESADRLNHKRWIAKRAKYMKMLQSMFKTPVPEKNFILKSIATEMISIPQGRFKMGRNPKEAKGCDDELPKHPVQINYNFWMAKTEITNGQYRIFYPQYRVKSWKSYNFNGITQPVVKVSWHLATEYCEMVTHREKKAKRLPEDYEYRLPTEAEWEYSCRAGTNTTYYWGDIFGEFGAKYANTLDARSARFLNCKTGKNASNRDGYFITAPVASYKPNAFGLYDMSGNVWEWCWDWYNPKAYKELFYIDPVQALPVVSTLEKRGDFERVYKIQATTKVIRGGGCLSPPIDARSATRDFVLPEKRDLGIGFRIVLAPKIELISPEPTNDEEE